MAAVSTRFTGGGMSVGQVNVPNDTRGGWGGLKVISASLRGLQEKAKQFSKGDKVRLKFDKESTGVVVGLAKEDTAVRVHFDRDKRTLPCHPKHIEKY